MADSGVVGSSVFESKPVYREKEQGSTDGGNTASTIISSISSVLAIGLPLVSKKQSKPSKNIVQKTRPERQLPVSSKKQDSTIIYIGAGAVIILGVIVLAARN